MHKIHENNYCIDKPIVCFIVKIFNLNLQSLFCHSDDIDIQHREGSSVPGSGIRSLQRFRNPQDNSLPACDRGRGFLNFVGGFVVAVVTARSGVCRISFIPYAPVIELSGKIF